MVFDLHRIEKEYLRKVPSQEDSIVLSRAWKRVGIKDPLTRMDVPWSFYEDLEGLFGETEYTPFYFRVMWYFEPWCLNFLENYPPESGYPLPEAPSHSPRHYEVPPYYEFPPLGSEGFPTHSWHYVGLHFLVKLLLQALQRCDSYQFTPGIELGNKRTRTLRTQKVDDITTFYFEVLSPNSGWMPEDKEARGRWMDAIQRWVDEA